MGPILTPAVFSPAIHHQVLSPTKFVRPIYAGNGLATVSVAPDFQQLIMATVSVSYTHLASCTWELGPCKTLLGCAVPYHAVLSCAARHHWDKRVLHNPNGCCAYTPLPCLAISPPYNQFVSEQRFNVAQCGLVALLHSHYAL